MPSVSIARLKRIHSHQRRSPHRPWADSHVWEASRPVRSGRTQTPAICGRPHGRSWTRRGQKARIMVVRGESRVDEVALSMRYACIVVLPRSMGVLSQHSSRGHHPIMGCQAFHDGQTPTRSTKPCCDRIRTAAMSWQATVYVSGLITCPNGETITRSEKFLALLLANRHNPDHDTAWPSIARLAKEALMNDRTIQRLLKSLEYKGVISREYRFKGPSEYDTTIYRFPGLSPHGGGGNLSPGRMSSPGREAIRGGGAITPPGGGTVLSPEPAVNRQMNRNGHHPTQFSRNGSQAVPIPIPDEDPHLVRQQALPVRGKTCGYDGCGARVCPHSYNFCAHHGCCDQCPSQTAGMARNAEPVPTSRGVPQMGKRDADRGQPGAHRHVTPMIPEQAQGTTTGSVTMGLC